MAGLEPASMEILCTAQHHVYRAKLCPLSYIGIYPFRGMSQVVGFACKPIVTTEKPQRGKSSVRPFDIAPMVVYYHARILCFNYKC